VAGPALFGAANSAGDVAGDALPEPVAWSPEETAADRPEAPTDAVTVSGSSPSAVPLSFAQPQPNATPPVADTPSPPLVETSPTPAATAGNLQPLSAAPAQDGKASSAVRTGEGRISRIGDTYVAQQPNAQRTADAAAPAASAATSQPAQRQTISPQDNAAPHQLNASAVAGLSALPTTPPIHAAAAPTADSPAPQDPSVAALSLPLPDPVLPLVAPQTSTTTDAPPVSAPTAQVAPALVSLAQTTDGAQRLTLHLEPGSLGHVQIQIDRPQDAAPRVEITVQRPQTLDLLLRDQPALQHALDQAGVPKEGRTLTFHLASSDPGAPSGTSGGGNQGSHQAGSHGAGAGGSGFGGSPNGNPGSNRSATGSSRNGGFADGITEIEGGTTPTVTPPRNYRAGLDITA
jgi:flagellar hook-length control protein FliK